MEENFGGDPPYKTSWYDYITDLAVVNDTATATTSLSSIRDANGAAGNICGALAFYKGTQKVSVTDANHKQIVGRASQSVPCR